MKYPVAREKVTSSTQTSFDNLKENKIKKKYRSVIYLLSSQDEKEQQQMKPSVHQGNMENDNQMSVEEQEQQPSVTNLQKLNQREKNSSVRLTPKCSQKQRIRTPVVTSRKFLSEQSQSENEQENRMQVQISDNQVEEISNYSIAPNHILFRAESHSKKTKKNPPQNKNKPLQDLTKLTHQQQQHQRIKRSKVQKIYLLSVTRTTDKDWTFIILGTQSIPYYVQFNKALLSEAQNPPHITTCTCVDFQRNYRPCKHIYFVVTQVAKADSLLNKITDQTQIDSKQFLRLDKLLLKRLGQRIQRSQTINIQESDNESLNQIQECAVCYIEMDAVKQKLQRCPTCRKHFHMQCLNTWKKHKNNCPLCRTQFNVQKIIRQPGALQRLHFVELNQL